MNRHVGRVARTIGFAPFCLPVTIPCMGVKRETASPCRTELLDDANPTLRVESSQPVWSSITYYLSLSLSVSRALPLSILLVREY